MGNLVEHHLGGRGNRAEYFTGSGKPIFAGGVKLAEGDRNILSTVRTDMAVAGRAWGCPLATALRSGGSLKNPQLRFGQAKCKPKSGPCPSIMGW